MMKKLFLFTLLVSSFLVISCSNKDTTGSTEEKPIGTGIDSIYVGTYEGTIYNPDPTTQSMTFTLTVNADGGGSLKCVSNPTVPNDINKVFFSTDIDKYSDTKYKFKDNIFQLDFNNDKTVYLTFEGTAPITLKLKP
ncbi:hypothetical protein [Brachyspira intermedia]|uniref:hypothetical protein n=1 Tax=Brachyspira intermedia TaxID=84377 RepID=UPI0030040741